MTPDPTLLVLVAHGTTRAPARSVVGTVVADVRRLLPEVEVRLAHVDVQSPALAQVLAGSHAARRRAVIVPLLLSAGFHVEVDIAEAVDPALDVVTPTLAGDPLLVELALARLTDAGGADPDAVVVAAAGSSRESARDTVHRFAGSVSAATGCPTTVGWVAGDAPDLDAVIAAAGPGRIGVVSYLLAPGVFAERARELGAAAGAVAVGAALGPDPRLAAIVVRRWGTAVTDRLEC